MDITLKVMIINTGGTLLQDRGYHSVEYPVPKSVFSRGIGGRHEKADKPIDTR